MKNVIIMGAAGRDFHVFNTCYRNNPAVRVVAFTAEQIPRIADRLYPPILAGARYPDGIPVHRESKLVELIGEHQVDEVIFAYSDISLEFLDQRRAVVEGAGARFDIFDVDATMVDSRKTVIAVTAVRTGACPASRTRRATEPSRRSARP